MTAPVNRDEFFDLIRRSGVLEAERLDTFARAASGSDIALDPPQAIAARMVRDGLLTNFQAKQILQGKWRRFLINGKYKLLELIGAGGMGAVYLCEHIFMRRLVALKVLPVDKLKDPSALERFYREARAGGALNHPNIVRAYDIDVEDNIHYLVMEYVDGSSLQEMVNQSGPMDPVRAAHYTRQAALGFQHAHEAGLVHRDVKPGNLLLDRSGTIKILDLGLARFFNAKSDNVTERYDDNAILGTADYLAPEQARGSAVDIRADIYALGGTFYFLVAGKAPFEDGNITQKLLCHQNSAPKSIREIRPDVPEGIVAVIERMMAKLPDQRYQTPQEVADALLPWTSQPISPPSADEMPRRSPAAVTPGSQGGPTLPVTPPPRQSPSTLRNGAASDISRMTTRPLTPSPLPSVVRPAASAPAASTVRDRPAPVVVAPKPIPVKAPPSKVAPPPVPRPRPTPELAVIPSPRTLIFASLAGAAVVFLIGGLLWWAFSGSEKKPTAERPQSPRAAPSVMPHSEAPGRFAKPDAVHPGRSTELVVGPEQAGQYLHQRCTVEMTVRNVGKAATADRYFLNSKESFRDKDNFQITFTNAVLEQLRAAGVTDVPGHFQGHRIRVTGIVNEYQSRPQIEVSELGQIQLLGASP